MDDLTDEQKADALELFKCDLNRQLFIETKNLNVRRIWLMKRIAPQVCAWLLFLSEETQFSIVLHRYGVY
jgi:hypothetical protein